MTVNSDVFKSGICITSGYMTIIKMENFDVTPQLHSILNHPTRRGIVFFYRILRSESRSNASKLHHRNTRNNRNHRQGNWELGMGNGALVANNQ